MGEDEEEEDEEEGDIFTEKSAVQPPGSGDPEVVEEMAKPPEKKVLTHTHVQTCVCICYYFKFTFGTRSWRVL